MYTYNHTHTGMFANVHICRAYTCGSPLRQICVSLYMHTYACVHTCWRHLDTSHETWKYHTKLSLSFSYSLFLALSRFRSLSLSLARSHLHSLSLWILLSWKERCRPLLPNPPYPCKRGLHVHQNIACFWFFLFTVRGVIIICSKFEELRG